MAFNDNKLGAADFSGQDISSIAGNTVVGQAAWLKARFDNVGENVIAPKFNQLIDDLQDTGAAAQIGASALTPDSGYTVGEQLQYLLDQIASAAVGDIPDEVAPATLEEFFAFSTGLDISPDADLTLQFAVQGKEIPAASTRISSFIEECAVQIE